MSRNQNIHTQVRNLVANREEQIEALQAENKALRDGINNLATFDIEEQDGPHSSWTSYRVMVDQKYTLSEVNYCGDYVEVEALRNLLQPPTEPKESDKDKREKAVIDDAMERVKKATEPKDN